MPWCFARAACKSRDFSESSGAPVHRAWFAGFRFARVFFFSAKVTLGCSCGAARNSGEPVAHQGGHARDFPLGLEDLAVRMALTRACTSDKKSVADPDRPLRQGREESYLWFVRLAAVLQPAAVLEGEERARHRQGS